MNFRTKYKVGDSFWIMHENKAKNLTIQAIKIQYFESNQDRRLVKTLSITYQEKEFGNWYDEEKIFETKEELLKSL